MEYSKEGDELRGWLRELLSISITEMAQPEVGTAVALSETPLFVEMNMKNLAWVEVEHDDNNALISRIGETMFTASNDLCIVMIKHTSDRPFPFEMSLVSTKPESSENRATTNYQVVTHNCSDDRYLNLALMYIKEKMSRYDNRIAA